MGGALASSMRKMSGRPWAVCEATPFRIAASDLHPESVRSFFFDQFTVGGACSNDACSFVARRMVARFICAIRRRPRSLRHGL